MSDPRVLDAAFLVGCARSGTSILGETLAAHERIAYLFEVSGIWKGIFTDRPDDSLAGDDANDRRAVEALHEQFTAALRELGGDVVLEKNPKHALRVAFLGRAFPRSRILHIVRDGRDVVASLMFRNRGSEWGHLRVPGWEELLAEFPQENHLRCAHQWVRAVRAARQEGRALGADRYVEVRYEDFVRRPDTVAQSLLRFLGLDMTPQVREFASRVQDATAGSYHAARQVRHYVENHTRRIGRYRENLDAEQLAGVEAVCGDLLTDLGYAV